MSKQVMSEELQDCFQDAQERILDNRYEPDKIICIMGMLKGCVLRELLEKERTDG
jgi:hypoxanthine phosphoribosyltransferase